MKTVWILGDQLLTEHAALGRTQPGESRVLMIESKARGSTLPYHQLKLVLVYSAMRHFAAELRESGWVVDYRLINETPAFEAGLRHHLETHRPDALVLAEPNSFPETDAITKLGRKLRAPIELVQTRQFLLPRDEFRVWAGGRKRLLMENHYRRMRKEHDCLMQPNGEPVRRRVEFRSRESRDVRVVAESGAFPRTQRAAREVGRDHARGDRDGEARGPNNPGHASNFGCRLTKRVRGSGLDASFASGCRVSASSKT